MLNVEYFFRSGSWRRCQIQEPRLREAIGDDQLGEVHPALTAVKHDAVGRGNNLAGVRQDVVGTEGQFHFHVPAGVGGSFQYEGLEAAAVGDRLVEPPTAAADTQGRGGFTDQAQGGQGFRQLAIAPVNAGDVPAAIVAAKQNNPAGQRTFEDGQHVVAVEPEFLALKPAGFDAKFLAVLNVFVSAGVAGDGHALAAGEVVPVAHQFDGGARGVAVVEQPAEVGGGGAQRGELPGGKEPLVLRSEAPVCLMPCHGGNKNFGVSL